MKILIYIFLTVLASNIYSQISDITRLPGQDEDKEYFESTPAVISENEILIFFCTGHSKNIDFQLRANDTLYYCKTNDGGANWSSPVYIKELGNTSYLRDWYLTSLVTSNGRILLVWADWNIRKIALIYSDDNAVSWSEPILINGGGNIPPLESSSIYNLSLSEIADNKLILSFNNEVSSQKESQAPIKIHNRLNRIPIHQ